MISMGKVLPISPAGIVSVERILRYIFGQPCIPRERTGIAMHHAMISHKRLLEVESNGRNRFAARLRLTGQED